MVTARLLARRLGPSVLHTARPDLPLPATCHYLPQATPTAQQPTAFGHLPSDTAAMTFIPSRIPGPPAFYSRF